MTLNERMQTLAQERERLAGLHARATDAVNQIAVNLIQLDAQAALLRELVQEGEDTEQWPPSGA